jgi:diphthamide biosynthesis protein 3
LLCFQLDFEDEPDDDDENASEAGSEEEDSEIEDENFEDAMENMTINDTPQPVSVAA